MTGSDSTSSNKIPIHSGHFLSSDQVLEAIQNSESTCTSTQRGDKSNVYVVVDNNGNSSRYNEFVDGFGLWECFLEDVLYYQKKIINKKLKYVAISPQPHNVLKVQRHYSQLKSKGNYRRRISIMTETSENLC